MVSAAQASELANSIRSQEPFGLSITVPANPEMQQYLEKLMVDVKYDMKAFMRVLFNTSTYQRQVTREDIAPGVVYHFTGPLLRRMSAEQMWDSFVTLINPNPDMINAAAREQMDQRVLQAKKVADGVDALEPEEMLRGIKMAAAIYDKNRERTDAKQKLYLEARTVAKAMQENRDGTQPFVPNTAHEEVWRDA